ncbi:uncharacterized protein ACOB8E_008226 [Sarcophilus harrisii]
MPGYVKVMGGAMSKIREEKRNMRARGPAARGPAARGPAARGPAAREPPPCSWANTENPCCEAACYARGMEVCELLVYCHCGALRSECRAQRLCGSPDMDPDTEALQPCRDRRCQHCFGPNHCHSDSENSEDEFSEDDFFEDSSEDSGFEEME